MSVVKTQTILLLLSLLVGLITSQNSDGSLTVGESYTILPSSSGSSLKQSFLLGKQFNITDNSTTIYFVSQSSETRVWWVNIDQALESIDIANPTGNIDLVQSILVNDTSGNFILSAGTIDPRVNGSMFISSVSTIYRIYPNQTLEILKIKPDPTGSTSFLPQSSATDTVNYRGFFPSSGGPYLYYIDFTTARNDFITVNTTSCQAIAINSRGTHLYIGGYEGEVEMISLDTLTTVAFSSGAEVTARYGANLVTRKLFADSVSYGRLYVCTVVQYDFAAQIWIEVLNSTTLEYIRAYHLLPESGSGGCGALTIDDDEGQIFVGVSDSNGGVMFAINIVTRTIRDFTPAPESDFVAAYKIGTPGVTEGQVVFFITNTQLTRLTYESTCLNDCSGNGYCSLGNCTCYGEYYTEDCSELRCPSDCSGHGVCADGTCVCDTSRWGGPNCTDRICPNECSSHGVCSGAPDYTCTCTGRWSGDDCSTPPPGDPPTPCQDITNLANCTGYLGCGWCITSKTCHDGSIRGPWVGSCQTWIWNSGFEIGVIILAAIFLGILFIMFVLNAISAVRIDFDRADDFEELYRSGVRRKPDHHEVSALWWRDVRSAKTWLLVEQFQFLVLVSHIAVDFPTNYINFTKFFDWTNLGLPLPFLEDKTNFHEPRVIHNHSLSTNENKFKLSSALLPDLQKVDLSAGRSLLGFEAYSNSLGLTANTLFGANMFWLAIAAASIVFVYGWLTLINVKKAHWKAVFISRMIYLLVRLGNLSYVGVVMTSSYALVAYQHKANLIVPAVFAFLIMGFGYPIGLYFLLKGDNKKLLDEEFKYRFGALYINYQPGNRLFVLMVFGRKFITAAMVGFLNYSLFESPRYISIIQVIIMGVAQIAYALVVFFRKPYYDYYHEYLEYFLTIINLITLGLSMLHYKSPSTPGMLITGLVQAIALVACTAVYIVSWVHMGLNLSICGGKVDKKEKKTQVKQSEPLNTDNEASSPGDDDL